MEQQTDEPQELPLWRELAVAISPLALQRPYLVVSEMDEVERNEAIKANNLFLQRYMDIYIVRSARLMVLTFMLFLLSFHLLPVPYLAAVIGGTMLLSLLHLALVIFWKQHLDDQLGPREPPE